MFINYKIYGFIKVRERLVHVAVNLGTGHYLCGGLGGIFLF